MENQMQDMTTIDVSALSSATGNNMVQAGPQSGTVPEFRHALQTEGESGYRCSVCFKHWPTIVEFNVHVCMLENLVQPANVVIIAPTQSTTAVQTSELSSQQELQPVAGQIPAPKDVESKGDHSITRKVKVEGKAYGKILPILLPDFQKVKSEIEKKGQTKCEVCHTEFSTSTELVNHMKKHTGELYRCEMCPSVFTSQESLQRHSRKHTQNSPSECSVCNAVFHDVDSCSAHMRTHLGKKAHTCEHCNKVFSYQKDYSVHLRTHTGERPYTCNVCQASFSQKGHLSRHMRTHSGERPHVCDECGATFSIRYRLLEHWRTHTKERPYVCSICDAAFSHLNTLKFHKRKHTGEKPYSCDHCGARFSHQTHLVVHTRRHTGERPYKCTLCDASYTRKNLLVIHIRKHTGERPFKCTQCSAAFAQNNYLKDHMRIHTGEKPFECDICHTCFSQRTSLRLHKKNHLNPQPKKGVQRQRKEGNMLDRMISTLGRNKQRRTRQAKEALKKEQELCQMLQEEANLKLHSKQTLEEEKAGGFVVVGVAKVEDTGITEAEVSKLDSALLGLDPVSESAANSNRSSGRRQKHSAAKGTSPVKLKLIVTSTSCEAKVDH